MRTVLEVISACAVVVLLAAMPLNASPSPTPADVAAADNAFGFRLLNAVQKTNPKANVVLSPVSAALDLAMALNGASGQTGVEMQTALSLEGLDLAAVNAANAGLIKVLRTPTKSLTLWVADSLWVDNRRVTLKRDYLVQTRHWYDAEITDLDFSSPEAPATINGWAYKQTHGKINKVIDQLDSADVALLLNAVYFKGQWTHKFDKAQTQERDFTLADGSIRRAPRMAQSGEFDYFETGDVQAIRLPYGTGDLVMDVFLPSTSSSLAALEANLTPEHWQAWQAQFGRRPGRIELPRFELKADYGLKGPLRALGMLRAFDPNMAQFKKMSDSDLFISAVRQSTYVRVDEEGSEAAAVTSIVMRTTSVEITPPLFRMLVDRPFFCAIEDRRSRVLLFVGAIYDPK